MWSKLSHFTVSDSVWSELWSSRVPSIGGTSPTRLILLLLIVVIKTSEMSYGKYLSQYMFPPRQWTKMWLSTSLCAHRCAWAVENYFWSTPEFQMSGEDFPACTKMFWTSSKSAVLVSVNTTTYERYLHVLWKLICTTVYYCLASNYTWFCNSADVFFCSQWLVLYENQQHTSYLPCMNVIFFSWLPGIVHNTNL